jgi:hypothetical protein
MPHYRIASLTPLPAVFETKITDSILDVCRRRQGNTANLEQYRQWQTWRDSLAETLRERICTQISDAFYLCFQLYAPDSAEQPWGLELQVPPRQDPGRCRIQSCCTRLVDSQGTTTRQDSD